MKGLKKIQLSKLDKLSFRKALREAFESGKKAGISYANKLHDDESEQDIGPNLAILNQEKKAKLKIITEKYTELLPG